MKDKTTYLISPTADIIKEYWKENTVIDCIDCDYSIKRDAFDAGKGRLLFNDTEQEHFVRCGICDDRCSDPHGIFPNDNYDEIDYTLGCEECGGDTWEGEMFLDASKEQLCPPCYATLIV